MRDEGTVGLFLTFIHLPVPHGRVKVRNEKEGRRKGGNDRKERELRDFPVTSFFIPIIPSLFIYFLPFHRF